MCAHQRDMGMGSEKSIPRQMAIPQFLPHSPLRILGTVHICAQCDLHAAGSRT